MKIFDKLEKQGFEGIDVNLEISLIDYGILAVYNDQNKDYLFIYGVDSNEKGYTKFDTSHITEQEVDEFLTDPQTWVNPDSVLLFTGMKINEWLNLPVIMKVKDLLDYYGYQNIFGDCYHPRNLLSLRKITL
jgi:hypothetical protein